MSAIYVGNGLARSAARTKGASHGAPACLLSFLLRKQICLPRVRARRPGAGRGYGVQRIRGTGAGSPDPLALAERAENSASCCKALIWMIIQQKETRRCGGYTSSVGCADTFPSRGRQKGETGPSSDRLTAATFPSRGRQKGCAAPHRIRRPQVLPLQGKA